MLLTSRETRRWVIPQGWPMKGVTPRDVAAREAFEEAGLVGSIAGKRPVGIFHYKKQLLREQLLCEVQVFLLWVDRQLDDWPEKGQRKSRWFDLPKPPPWSTKANLPRSCGWSSHPIGAQRSYSGQAELGVLIVAGGLLMRERQKALLALARLPSAL
jgi:ADP-ribose pyrophosphatase YjhB (NUDIX family)